MCVVLSVKVVIPREDYKSAYQELCTKYSPLDQEVWFVGIDEGNSDSLVCKRSGENIPTFVQVHRFEGGILLSFPLYLDVNVRFYHFVRDCKG